MKMLLAGPGTGKTTKVKSLIKGEYAQAENILVLSFTNATISDLRESFRDFPNVNSYTLHSYALKINHLHNHHVLDDYSEYPIIEKYSEKTEIDVHTLCDILKCFRFQDMIKQCIQFIKSNPVYASNNIGQLDLLIIDEFQDFNEIERKLVFLLSTYSEETLILGDDDQSIYDFKDADPDGIISLYENKTIEKIPHENICYRCPDIIVEQGAKLINNNTHRVKKDWKPSDKDGDIVFEQKMSQNECFEYVTSQINEIKSKAPESSILVLSPVRFYISELMELLDEQNIYYIDFWNSMIDDELRQRIWILKSLFGEHKITFMLLLGYKVFKLHNRRRFIEDLKSLLKNGICEQDFIRELAPHYPESYSGYLTMSLDEFIEGNGGEYKEILEHIDPDNLIESIGNLEQTINPTQCFDRDAVNVMSIHKSKGLQADYVFITGLNEGVLPNDTKGIDSIEAQRRLLFVGMTRALEKLYMISTVEWDGKYVNRVDKKKFKFEYRKKIYYGKTSRFLEEMS